MVAIATLAIAGVALLVVVGVVIDQRWQHREMNEMGKEIRLLKSIINHGKERETKKRSEASEGPQSTQTP